MKSVLVIDTPEFCAKCPLLHLGNRFVCRATNRWCGDEKGYYTSETKPTWCPLKPLPEEWVIDYDLDVGGDIDYGMGWNHCLQEITGEKR